MLILCASTEEEANSEAFNCINMLVNTVNNDASSRICSAVAEKDGDTSLYYHNMDVGHLRQVADTLQDEATLRFIAENKERISYFEENCDEDLSSE